MEQFGKYYIFYALMLLTQLVSEAGITTVLTCRIALGRDHWRKTMAEAAGLLVVAVLVSSAGLLVMGVAWAGWRNDPGALTAFAWVGLACAAVHIQRFCSGVFQGFELFQYDSVSKILQSLLFAVLVVLLLGPGPGGLGTALALLAASNLAAALYLAISLQRRFPCRTIRLNLALLWSWLREAGPLGLADVLRRLTWQTDILLLGLLQPPALVGIYSVANRPLATLNWVPFVILTATLPSLARLAGGDRAALDRAFCTSMRLLWICSLPIAVAIFVLAEPVVVLLAGRQYLEAAQPMRILIWITSLLFVSVPYRFLFAALGRPRLYLGLVILVLGLAAGIEAALIPSWGYFGAALGSLTGETVFMIAGLVICFRLGMKGLEWPAFARAAVAAGGMGTVLWTVRGADGRWVGLTLLVATAAYFLLCVFLGALRWQEVRHFQEALAGFFQPVGGRRGRRVRPIEDGAAKATSSTEKELLSAGTSPAAR